MTTALTPLGYDVVVSGPSHHDAKESTGKLRPAHHLNDKGTLFTNPWPSFRPQTTAQWTSFFFKWFTTDPDASQSLAAEIPIQVPTWGATLGSDTVKATWLGHACFLVELPAPQGASRGPRIIFDPACSHRCSPFKWLGPQRYTPLPCRVEDFPSIDAIVLSHNHYDHTDSPTIEKLHKRDNPHVFAPLGNQPYLASLGIPKDYIHVLDWWGDRNITLSLPTLPKIESGNSQLPSVKSTFKITCTPCQHTANRGMFDRWHSLWSSWAVEEVPSDQARTSSPKKVYFAGDTGYRTVRDGENEEDQPVCPAFAEIGERIGPFDLALIPIGAYSPRVMWSNLHAHPSDSVRIFRDVKAKKALGMHWGTWVLTSEAVLEPPRLLKEEAKKLGLPDGDFDVCAIGETRGF
ncbi:unnamed protein product [Somion occarium]|uniref:Metallo-beta-lactamase domain-containing protein n=1 Tax=Somion occarium TaxID=3059160 RepID=A0ABP1DV63_9APHY